MRLTTACRYTRAMRGLTCLLTLAFTTVMPLNAADNQREETPTSIVQACVDANGQLVNAEIVESSGYPQIDEAALKIARANKYSAGKDSSNKKMKVSCIKFKVKFVIKDGEPVPG